MPDSRCPTAEAKALNRNQIKLGVVFGVSPSCVDVDWTGLDWSGVEWSGVKWSGGLDDEGGGTHCIFCNLNSR